MPRPHIVKARHAQGLAAYRAGHSIAHLIDVFEEIDALHQAPGLSNEEHNDIENSGPSLICGFADGLIADIRLLAAARRGQTA